MLPWLLFRLGILFLGALNIFFAPSMVYAAPPRFGIWVEAEGENRPFVSRSSIDGLKDFLAKGQFSDVYAQVYRGGRSWFPSTHADPTPYREARARGLDPLRELIDQAHRDGRRVHAWLNLLRVEKPDARIIQLVGKEGVLRDSAGNSLLSYSSEGVPPGELGQYYRLDTPGIWLDPAVELVRRQLLLTIRDVISAYPDIDGIHLDMIRFPFGMGSSNGRSLSFELGYSSASVSGFYKSRELSHVAAMVTRTHEENCSLDAESRSCILAGKSTFNSTRPPTGEEWDEWRRLQITLLVFEIRELLSHVAPHVELSAAVLAWQERAHDRAFQDWESWMRGGLIDTAIPMAYTADSSVFTKLSRDATQLAPRNKIMMGIGAWLLLRDSTILHNQVEAALTQKAEGVVLFSFSNLFNERGRKLITQLQSFLAKRQAEAKK